MDKGTKSELHVVCLVVSTDRILTRSFNKQIYTDSFISFTTLFQVNQSHKIELKCTKKTLFHRIANYMMRHNNVVIVHEVMHEFT